MNKFNLKPGQTVWVKTSMNRSALVQTEVTKVGRVWAHIKASATTRVFLVNLLLEDGRGCIYLSEEAYISQLAIARAWSAFRSLISLRFPSPSGVTVEDIQKAIEILKLKVPSGIVDEYLAGRTPPLKLGTPSK